MQLSTAGDLYKAGLPVAIMTDHPEIPEQYLPLSAALAKKGGMPETAAIQAITVSAAKVLGVDDRYGTITAGKAPDLVLLDGDPLKLESEVVLVVGSGRIVVDRR